MFEFTGSFFLGLSFPTESNSDSDFDLRSCVSIFYQEVMEKSVIGRDWEAFPPSSYSLFIRKTTRKDLPEEVFISKK